MVQEKKEDPRFEWLDHVENVGLVVSRQVLGDLDIIPVRQTRVDTAEAAELIAVDRDEPALPDPWAFFNTVLQWPEGRVAGAPGGPALPELATISLPELETTLSATWAVQEREDPDTIQLLVRIEDRGIDPDRRGALQGWEATPQQRFERLLRESKVFRGVLVTDKQIRVVHAPGGETAGWIGWPIHDLTSVAGRAMLGGLKLMLGRPRLFTDPTERRLPALLDRSREAQASVSIALSGQVLGALHELLRGLRAQEDGRNLIDDLAARQPQELYGGLLTVMMRLVFTLFAEDRELLPSATDARSRELYDAHYSIRGLYDRLLEDQAVNPDTMDERRGAWGRLLALFRLIHGGHGSGWIRGRGGQLFDPDRYQFLEGRRNASDEPCVLPVTDGCILRILDGLMMLDGERLSYKALDVEQIGSVYETVMGFKVERTRGAALAIRAGKNSRVPVYVDLEGFLDAKPADRRKRLKEEHDRASLTKKQEDAIKAARSVEELTSALDGIVDERGSPGKHPAPPGTPILQPTDERRATGSHYTPRSLTEPIVRQALEPIFMRIGDDATPEEVLDIKVCDPAMGSGAFLVEACRALAARLVLAWTKHPGTRPALPEDEDEDLLARRLVAQRCLYGVDINPMAADLGRLSLWLATLARDHEFTFLDHAIKSGDSLVGLTREQIVDLTWADADAGKPLFRTVVDEALKRVSAQRTDIREAPEDERLGAQLTRHRAAETFADFVRRLGDAILSTFFLNDKARARKHALDELQVRLTETTFRDQSEVLDLLRPHLAAMAAEERKVRPFHWEIEFPEVFDRENRGFDAFVGNPPFAGKNTVAARNHANYGDWLKHAHPGSHGNADLVAHFFRRAYRLLRKGGTFGLIASNTIAQGDTRESGLLRIIQEGGAIYRATRRLKWPGEAAVVVSTVHVTKSEFENIAFEIKIDNLISQRISAFLVDNEHDKSPTSLKNNENMAFIGHYILGMGFTFDDKAAEKGTANPISEMENLISRDPRNAERIKRYIGGEEINNDPRHQHRRYVIDFEDFPLFRDPKLAAWFTAPTKQRNEWLREGIVPIDYADPVAEDWPDLLKIITDLVKPSRRKDKRKNYRKFWWRFAERRRELENFRLGIANFLCISRVSPMLSVARRPSDVLPAESCVVFIDDKFSSFTILQSRIHEIWARTFSSSMKDDLRYAPSDCFATFPFPRDDASGALLESSGCDYHEFRADLMVRTDQGMTPTYNRFHDPSCSTPDIDELRRLHHEMDCAVLRAYGWDDLADRANPIFLGEENELDFAYQGRLFWPATFRDEVLARLLDLNRERALGEEREAAEMKAAGGHTPKRRRKPKQSEFDLGQAQQYEIGLEDDT
ncbi:Eco57I restriction-modification methylase domain-containing protein [Minwuia thermotolerans]|uniref:Eco57I restriction-modification methylase domain-containing protein n=1 Tax=Minwuia thermotolerans TaxID=2056226 RepID=UPI000D6DC461|nr:DNA methyltransferase [Minwuia thermotolerans]